MPKIESKDYTDPFSVVLRDERLVEVPDEQTKTPVNTEQDAQPYQPLPQQDRQPKKSKERQPKRSRQPKKSKDGHPKRSFGVKEVDNDPPKPHEERPQHAEYIYLPQHPPPEDPAPRQAESGFPQQENGFPPERNDYDRCKDGLSFGFCCCLGCCLFLYLFNLFLLVVCCCRGPVRVVEIDGTGEGTGGETTGTNCGESWWMGDGNVGVNNGRGNAKKTGKGNANINCANEAEVVVVNGEVVKGADKVTRHKNGIVIENGPKTVTMNRNGMVVRNGAKKVTMNKNGIVVER